MAKALAGIIAILLTMGSFGPVLAGDWTTHGFLYKPSPGARGTVEKGRYDSGQDRVDARLNKEIWIGDPNYGTTLQDAISAIGSAKVMLHIPAGPHNITANLTIPANVNVKPECGALLSVATGTTLTINGPLDAGLYQIFSLTGTGKVSFGAGAIKAVIPQWFGAKADGVTNSSAAFQAAFDSLPLGTTHGWTFLIPPGDYYIPTAVNLPGISLTYTGFNMAPCYITGHGATLLTDQANTIFKRWPTNDTTDPNAYAQTAYLIEGIQFKGTGLRAQIGLDLACTYGSRIINCRFATLGRGLRLSYAMLAEVVQCLANGCGVAGFSETDGYGLWSTGHTWTSTTVKYSRCRVYPATALTPVAIAGLTRANPCVVTWTAHGLATGDIVFFNGLTQASWTALNARRFQITKINDNSFSLKLLDRTDTPANLDTSGYAADYVPATDPGVIHAARFGFEFLNSYNPKLDHCYVDGGTVTDSIFFYHRGYSGLTVDYFSQELTPLGAGLYLNNKGSFVTLNGFGGSGTTLDMFDIVYTENGLVTITNYLPDSGKIRLPADNIDANFRIAFKGGGTLGTGFDILNPAYWYQGTAPFRVTNYTNDGNPRIQGISVLLDGGRGTFVKQESYTGAYYPGVYYEGLKSEANASGGGGVGAYDITNGQAIMVKQKSSEVTITASSVAIQDVSSFIPAGVMVVGFTARVTQAIGGAATLSVGETGSANLWLNAMGVALNSTGNLTSTTATAPKIYAAATTVRLTANGGNFNGTGKVRLTVHYISLEAPGS